MCLKEFQDTVAKAARADTSSSPEGWSPEQPLWGHCAVVTLLAQDNFGGKIMRIDLAGTPFEAMGSHYRNLLPDGQHYDFTAAQFGAWQFPNDVVEEERARDYLLSNAQTFRRYRLLAQRFSKLWD